MPNNGLHNVTGSLNLAPVSLGMVRKTVGNTVSFSGTGFGSGPTIDLFDRFDRGTDGQVLSLTDGVDVGAWSGYSSTVSGSQNTAYCRLEAGRKWMANRHLSFLNDTASRACGLEKQLSASLSASTEIYDLPPASRSSTAVSSVAAKPWEQLAYASLILADGAIAETKVMGW